MKKITPFVLGLTAVCALTACGGKSSKAAGKKVEEAEFEKKAQETQSKEKTFTEATLTYSFIQETEVSGQDIPKMEENGEAKFTYEGGRWSTNTNIPAMITQLAAGMVGFDLMKIYEEVDELLDAAVEKVYAEYANMGIKEDAIETELNFYEEPIAFEFWLDIDTKVDEGGVSVKLDLEQYELMEFNDYGLASRYYLENKIDMEASYAGEDGSMSNYQLLDLQIEYK